jgi:hypothetical protein
MIGGLSTEEAMLLSEEERIQAMLDFIATRSVILINELRLRESNNKTGVMDLKATETYSSVLTIQRNSQIAKETMTPMSFFELGKSMEGIKTSLALIEGFTELRKRSDNGKVNGKLAGEIRAKEAKNTGNEIERIWHQLSNTPERERASKIATRMSISSKAVRDHIRERQLRK